MKTNLILFAAICLLLCACHGIQAGPIIGGVAGGVAVLDQLLAGGVIDPVQHHQLATALTDVGKVAADAATVAQQAQVAVTHAKEGTLSTEEGVGVAVGVSGVIAAGLNAYRNMTRKQALAAPVTA
jgi:hypothetical protein